GELIKERAPAVRAGCQGRQIVLRRFCREDNVERIGNKLRNRLPCSHAKGAGNKGLSAGSGRQYTGDSFIKESARESTLRIVSQDKRHGRPGRVIQLGFVARIIIRPLPGVWKHLNGNESEEQRQKRNP